MNYLKKLTFLVVFIIFSVYLLNISVDPYEKFGINFWNLKFKSLNLTRDIKMVNVNSNYEIYDAYILGSSRVQEFDPKYLQKLTGYESYNYSVNNAKAEDYLAIVNHILSIDKPKLIYLQLDFYSIEEDLYDRRFEQSKLKEFLIEKNINTSDTFSYVTKSYFTLEATKESIKNIWKNKLGTYSSTLREDGLYIRQSETSKITPLEMSYFKKKYVDYTFDNSRINYLKKIKKVLDEKKIKLVVTISPMNTKHLIKVYEDKNLFESFLKFKQIVVNIFDEVYDFNTVDVKNYNSNYWVDSVHSTYELAYLMMDNVFLDTEVKFGNIVNNNNLSSYLKEYEKLIATLKDENNEKN